MITLIVVVLAVLHRGQCQDNSTSSTPKSYEGYQVIRMVADNDQQLQAIKQLADQSGVSDQRSE